MKPPQNYLPFVLLTTFFLTACGRAGDAASAAPTADAVAGTHPLSGFFVKTEITGLASSRLRCTYYIFFPSGHIYFGLPPGGNDIITFAGLQKAHPENCGSYGVIGEELTLQRNGQAPEKHTYTPNGGGIMDGAALSTVFHFTDNQRIEGTWGLDAAMTGSNFSASSSTYFTFHRDGTFLGTGHAGIDTNTATGLTTTSGKGTYQFGQGNLTITYDDGTTKTFSAFGTDSVTQPRILVIDSIEYNASR